MFEWNMKFIQIIEFRTSRIEELDALLDDWLERTEGTRTTSWQTQTKDRDQPNTYLQIVEFPSYEVAMANSDRSETSDFAAQMAALCDGPPIFRNLDVLRSVHG